MGKPGIAFGWRHLAWETSENMGCDLWQRNFSNVFSFSADLDILFSGSFSHLVKFYSYAQDFHPDVLCNGKHPRIK